MITDYPHPPVDRAVPADTTTNRAVEAPEPLNRRGRRYLEREIRRTERQNFRQLRREELADRAR